MPLLYSCAAILDRFQSNCVVRSCGSRPPCSFVADHGIESGDHLSHDGDDNDFRFLVGCGETIVKDLERDCIGLIEARRWDLQSGRLHIRQGAERLHLSGRQGSHHDGQAV